LIAYLAEPASASKLAKAYQVWRRDWREVKERSVLIHDTSAWLRKVGNVEDYVNPNLAFARGETLAPYASGSLFPDARSEESGEEGIGEAVVAEGEMEQVNAELNDFRVYVRRWLE